MSRIFYWFWFLVLMWCFAQALTPPVARAAQSNSEQKEKEKSKFSIPDFLIGSSKEEKNIATLQPVTVIASRLPSFRTQLTDIPANVTFKSKEDLEQSNPHTFQDAVRDVEGGIFYDQVGNGVDETFLLRGFSKTSAVIVLVDGVRVNELDSDPVNFPLLAAYDIESIQIDRGSASPVYGSGAFGGIVHVTTGRPSKKPISLFGGMEISSFKGIKFNQGTSGTLPDCLTPIDGKVTYYFNMGRDLSEGFRDNGDWRITSLDTKVGYELPNEDGGVHFGLKYVKDALANPGALTASEFHINPEQTANPLAGRDFRNTILQLGGDKKFWDQRLSLSVLSSLRINQIHFYTTSRTFPQGVFNPDTDLVTTRSKTESLVWEFGYQDRWKSLENQSQVGMELMHGTEYDLQQQTDQGIVVQSRPLETERNAKPIGSALFWRETLKLYDRIVAHVGMRHDFDWLKTRDFLTPTSNLSRRWNHSSLSTGLTLKPVQFIDIFGNYSQGFRVPTISDIAPFASGIANDLSPEQTDSYETGTRLWYKNLAQAKASFFLIDLKNEIVFDSTAVSAAAPFGQNINIGRSRRDGIETRLDLTPFRELSAYGSYTWMKAWVRETAGSGVPFVGKDIGLIPRHRFTIGASVKPLARLGVPFNGLQIGLDGVYTGRQFVQSHESESQALINAAGETIDGYVVWDMSVVFEWRKKKIYFRINNLFDKGYYSRAVAATNFGSAITPPGTHLFVNPGAPREYVLGATWEFD